jgi:cell division septum initiation protein DivIVA
MNQYSEAYPETITKLLRDNEKLKEENNILEKELKIVISDNKQLAVKIGNLEKKKQNYFFGM